eukprot:4462845-Pyramimonas_sp.AAC.1
MRSKKQAALRTLVVDCPPLAGGGKKQLVERPPEDRPNPCPFSWLQDAPHGVYIRSSSARVLHLFLH